MKKPSEFFSNGSVQRERFSKFIDNLRDTLPRNWKMLLLGLVLFVSLAGVSAWSLSQIPEDAASLEVVNTMQTQSWSDIAKDPLYLPHKALSYLALLFTDSVRAVRSVSVVMFLLCGVALFSLLKRWHSSRVAVLTLILFGTNATVLAISRLADPLVMLFTWSILLSLLLWVIHSNSKHIAPISLAFAGFLLLYIPGALYVFLVLFVLFLNRIKDFFKNISLRSGIISGVMFFVAISPLVYASVQDITVLRTWALLPETVIYSDIPKNILAVPSSYFYRFQIADPLITVGRLPILDIASGALMLLGAYSYYRNRVLERTKIMVLGALLAVLLGALGEVRLGVTLFLPFAFILMAGGVSYLLDTWYVVFPKNPLARNFAFIVLILVVAASSMYQLKKFFVVWPNTPETSEVYNEPRLIQ